MGFKEEKDQFNKLLKASPSKAVLSVEQSRKFSRRARMNMISNLTTSYKLEKDEKATTPSDVARYKERKGSHNHVF